MLWAATAGLGVAVVAWERAGGSQAAPLFHAERTAWLHFIKHKSPARDFPWRWELGVHFSDTRPWGHISPERMGCLMGRPLWSSELATLDFDTQPLHMPIGRKCSRAVVNSTPGSALIITASALARGRALLG